MIFMHFTFPIILLAVGFGVGYWLLIAADKQEGSLKNLGNTLGYMLVFAAILLLIFSCYYSIRLSQDDYKPVGCEQNMQKMDNVIDRESAEQQTIQKHREDSSVNSGDTGEIEDALPENKGMSIKKDNEDTD